MSIAQPDHPRRAGLNPGRRRLLGGGLSLLALSWLAGVAAAGRGGGKAVSAAAGDGYVIIDGWVLPARYFRD